MKFLIIALLTVIATPVMANTTLPVAVPVRVQYATTGVSTGTYLPILNLTAKGTKTIKASNSSNVDIAVGVTYYGAPAGSETNQFIVPAGASIADYPLNIAAGMRISIISIGNAASTGGSASTGTGVFNIFYY